ncbi:hypothetical protein A4X09_0g6097 [Tilletia walkeri]|uniref:Uncharacterized protein n=1 Tax=Tilletia walkeri TaxID=117179 RepID=A0A8X7T300_9BASI|nr:hypothetical protein A4X09_0g6097 [Tilletia walkeri]
MDTRRALDLTFLLIHSQNTQSSFKQPIMRLFTTATVAALHALSTARALHIPDNVFSLDDLKGADTRPIEHIYAFGDSYTDSCNLFRTFLNDESQAKVPWPNCPPPPYGRADLGQSWIEIAQDLQPKWNVSNYASSGATCDNRLQNQGRLDIDDEVDLFTTNYGKDSAPHELQENPATSLAVLFIGVNDIHLIQQKKWGQLSPPSFSNGTVKDSASCVRDKFKRLHSLGFRRFLLFELPPLDYSAAMGSTPQHALSTANQVAHFNAFARQYADGLLHQWKDDSTISIFPTSKLMTPMMQLNPAYDFKHGQGKYCTAISGGCARPHEYTWTDDLHPSLRVFQLMANAFVRFLDPGFESGLIFSGL